MMGTLLLLLLLILCQQQKAFWKTKKTHLNNITPICKRCWIELLWAMESRSILRIANAKNRGFYLVMHQYPQNGKISSEERQCSMFYETRKKSCIIKCSNRLKLSTKTATDNNSSISMGHTNRSEQNTRHERVTMLIPIPSSETQSKY